MKKYIFQYYWQKILLFFKPKTKKQGKKEARRLYNNWKKGNPEIRKFIENNMDENVDE